MKSDPTQMFCSTIIPTINRSTLARAVHSVLDQELIADDFQVVVVNDSGKPLPDAEWQHCDCVQVINTNRHERSVARNTGAAIARGRYFHFLDDDDVLLPGALQAFWNLSQANPTAAWLYGGYQTVDSDGNLVNEFFPGIQGNIFPLLIAGEAIPFQTSLLNSKYFYAAGTFDPNINGVEDRDLGRRIALQGSVAYMPVLAAKIRIGEQGSTTNWKILAEDDRWGREKALRIRDSFARLNDSAISSYWRGRVSRAYLASTVWNLKRRQMFTASSRAIAGLAFARWYWLSPNFWNGLRTRVN